MDQETQRILENIKTNTETNIGSLTKVLNTVVKESQDYMVSSLIKNDNIFTQVKNHILNQDLIVEQYQATVSLKWVDNKIFEEVDIEYYVRNISSIEQEYLVDTYVFNNAFNLKLTPYISRYYVRGNDCLNDTLKSRLNSQRQNASTHIGFDEFITIERDSSAKIEIGFAAYREANDHELFVTSQITDTMKLHLVQYPEDINISCHALHSGDSFVKPKKGNQYSMPSC